MLVSVIIGTGNASESIAYQGEQTTNEKQLVMQENTTKYFVGADGQKDDSTTKQEERQEQDIRVRTGGPVFAVEEADSIRAARISVLAELVSVSTPSVMARYCSILIPLIVDTLQLETSRLVGRAAALLARELYTCVLREGEDLAMRLDQRGTARRLKRLEFHSPWHCFLPMKNV